MNNQPQVSMTITGLMLKSYMIVARTWASANKAIQLAKQTMNNSFVSSTLSTAKA